MHAIDPYKHPKILSIYLVPWVELCLSCYQIDSSKHLHYNDATPEQNQETITFTNERSSTRPQIPKDNTTREQENAQI